MRNTFNRNQQSGFTLVEIIISTAIFVTVVSAMLTLFNYTLQINRRVQALREVVQSSRAFTETLSREIRNGRIDYDSHESECDSTNYTYNDNQSLAIITRLGDKLCFYINPTDQRLYLKKQSPTADTTNSAFESANFRIIPETLRFYVRPKLNPNPLDPQDAPEQQPFVTIVAQFELTRVDRTPTIVNYQTTISTDVYDTFNNN